MRVLDPEVLADELRRIYHATDNDAWKAVADKAIAMLIPLRGSSPHQTPSNVQDKR